MNHYRIGTLRITFDLYEEGNHPFVEITFDGGVFEQFEALVESMSQWCYTSVGNYGSEWWSFTRDGGWTKRFEFKDDENLMLFKLTFQP